MRSAPVPFPPLINARLDTQWAVEAMDMERVLEDDMIQACMELRCVCVLLSLFVVLC